MENYRRCRDETLVGAIVYMATIEKPKQRAAMLRMLLEHGAKPTPVGACHSPDDGDCEKVLWPLMEPYYKQVRLSERGGPN